MQLPPARAHTAEGHWLQPGAGSGGLVRSFSFLSPERQSLEVLVINTLNFQLQIFVRQEGRERNQRDHNEGNSAVRGEMLSYPIYCHMPAPVMCFIALTDQSYPGRGWSRQSSARPHLCGTATAMPMRQSSVCTEEPFIKEIWEILDSFPMLLQWKEN